MRVIHLLNNPHDSRSQEFCDRYAHKYPTVNWYVDEEMMQRHLQDYPPFRSLPCVLVQHDTYVVTILNESGIEATYAVPAGFCYLEPTDDTDDAIVQQMTELTDWVANGKTINV